MIAPLLVMLAALAGAAPGELGGPASPGDGTQAKPTTPSAQATRAAQAAPSTQTTPATETTPAAQATPSTQAKQTAQATPSAQAAQAQQAADERAKQDERARAAFHGLTHDQKRELLDFLEYEVMHSGSFQSALIDWVRNQQEREPSSWPTAGPPPIYDPTVHAPGQPIPRKVLDWKSAEARAAAQRILGTESGRVGAAPVAGRPPVRAMQSAWTWDYGARELRRVVWEDEQERVFENALHGYPPRLDFTEAAVEGMLDDGSQQKRAQAFAHAYADRAGNVFPGISLYDAHASGKEIEMPDVEILGIVHDLKGDWTSWVAPIPSIHHDALYEKVGAEFLALHRHRGLRHALAVTFCNGTDVLRDGYQGNLDNFHALWEACSSTPATVKERLPDPAGWAAFLEGWRETCLKPDSPYRAGQARREVLDREAAGVRATLLRVLAEYGAFDALDRAKAGGR